MKHAIKIILLLVVCLGGVGVYAYSRGWTPPGMHPADANSANGGGKGAPPVPAVPVGATHVKEQDLDIFLDGLGTVQALKTVTIHPQIEGVVDKVSFVEGQDVKIGTPLAHIDSRSYQAQLDQAKAKKKQDEAKTEQDRAKVIQDRAKKQQDEALEQQAASKKLQDEAIGKQGQAKQTQDQSTFDNARVNLKRFEDSFKTNAVSEQVVTDQRSLVAQLEALVNADKAAVAATAEAVRGDEVAIKAIQALIQGDAAAINADLAAVDGDVAAVESDDGAIKYAETFLSYCTITSPIAGRTGVRQVDEGNLVRTTDTTGIVVLTQLQPISVIFTLPQQNLQAINARQAQAKLAGMDKPDVLSGLKVMAMDSVGKSVIDDSGELLLVDNQIDPTTGTIRMKATFKNKEFKLWPGGFVDIRLLLETRPNTILVKAPAVQQGPNGTYVFLIKTDPGDNSQSVEMRSVKVGLIQDGMAVIEEGLVKGDQVVFSGHDRLKNGTKVAVSARSAAADSAAGSGEKKPDAQTVKSATGAAK